MKGGFNVDGFGEKLVELREKKGYTQKKLAELLEITPTRLNYWEKNKREPDFFMFKKIATVLDVNPNVLLGLSDNVTYSEKNADIGIELYNQLDDIDKAEIRGEMKQMLKAEKYNDIEKGLQNA